MVSAHSRLLGLTQFQIQTTALANQPLSVGLATDEEDGGAKRGDSIF